MVWRKILRQDFLTPAGNLKTTLGAWYDDAERHHRRWPGYIDRSRTRVWKYRKTWQCFKTVMISRQRGMIGKAKENQLLPLSRTPITFEKDRPFVFRSRKILPVFNDPRPLETITAVSEQVIDVSENNELKIWQEKDIWYWRLRSDKVRCAGLATTLSKYKSFLGTLWSASPYLPNTITIKIQ